MFKARRSTSPIASWSAPASGAACDDNSINSCTCGLAVGVGSGVGMAASLDPQPTAAARNRSPNNSLQVHTVTYRLLLACGQTGRMYGAEGGCRTHTPFRAADFKSAASTVPPPRHSKYSVQPFRRGCNQERESGGGVWRRRAESNRRIRVLQTLALTTWLRRLGLWCPGRDSNPHGLPHGPLKTACLPVPPPGPDENQAEPEQASALVIFPPVERICQCGLPWRAGACTVA